MYWSEGEISARNLSELLIAKMCEVARVLGARVRGDDGEFYGGEFYDGDGEVGEGGTSAPSGRRRT